MLRYNIHSDFATINSDGSISLEGNVVFQPFEPLQTRVAVDSYVDTDSNVSSVVPLEPPYIVTPDPEDIPHPETVGISVGNPSSGCGSDPEAVVNMFFQNPENDWDFHGYDQDDMEIEDQWEYEERASPIAASLGDYLKNMDDFQLENPPEENI